MDNTISPIYKSLEHFFDVYLTQRDIKKTLELVTDDILYVGTGLNETALNKNELEKLLIEEMKIMPYPVIFTTANYYENLCCDNVWNCFFDMTVDVKITDIKNIRFSTRFTGTVKRIDGKYLLSSKHMSEPSANQEENEFFPISFFSTNGEKMGKDFQQSLLETLIKNIPGGIMGVFNEKGFPTYIINDSMLKMLDYTYDQFIEKTNGMIEFLLHPDDLESAHKTMKSCIIDNLESETEYRIRKSNGEYIWIHEIARKITTEDGRDVALCVIVNISDKVLIQECLTEETMRDSLTNLYNRKACNKLIADKLIVNDGFVFLMVDIDKFKAVNDIYGHHTGDVVLIYLAEQLKNNFRSSDIIVRLGGDEFIIYIHSICDIDSLMNKMNRINNDYIKKMNEIAPTSNSLLSIGGIYGKGSYNFSDIYQASDSILYNVKKSKIEKVKIHNIKDINHINTISR